MGSDIRESAFRNIDQASLGDYRDEVIKIVIRGRTVDKIDEVAELAGMTSTQWIMLAIATELIRYEKSINGVVDDYMDKVDLVMREE